MEDESQILNAEDGRLLLRLARSALLEKLGRPLPAAETERLRTALKGPRFHVRRGTFVTLSMGGELRGCIGNLFPTDPLVEGVRRNAAHAAFQDPRFKPLTENELDQVMIEVSILTHPQPLPYSTAQDLIQRLRPHLDGVIIRQGYASATFLPQVWDQLQNTEDFLGHLCLKAGLSRDAWKRSKLEVATYQVQRFDESIE
jgi:AmmeMemoRadiSam system protein A